VNLIMAITEQKELQECASTSAAHPTSGIVSPAVAKDLADKADECDDTAAFDWQKSMAWRSARATIHAAELPILLHHMAAGRRVQADR
jgi:hypothetical protein